MDMLRLPSFTRLAIMSLLLAPTFAQNSTTGPSSDSCRVDFDPKAPVNATGSLNIHWNALMMDPTRNDWTFTLTYNEIRDPNGTVHRWNSYVSVPEASEAKMCTFMLAGLNKTSSSRQRNGCDGVIDDACTSILREIMYTGGDCSWPTPVPEYIDRLQQACGTDIMSTDFRTHLPVDFANNTTHCNHSNPPGSASPENYRTFLSASQARNGVNWGSDRNTLNFTWYDIYMKQTVPFVVAGEFLGGIAETQVLCVAPNKIAEGSRIPVQKSAASTPGRPSSWMTVGPTVIAIMLMALA